MKKTLTCPKCDGRKIWHVPTLLKDYVNGEAVPQPISLIGDVSWGGRPLGASLRGEFEAFICAACGLSELYAKGIEGFHDGPGMRLIDNTPKATLR